MNLVLIGVLFYVAVQLALGMAVSRGIRTRTDYFLAGRNVGYALAIFSIFATWFGAETCIGSAGRVYEVGLSGGSADPFGYALCLIAMGLVFAAPLWRRKLTTLADLFRIRYSPGVERLAVLMMVPTSVMWAAAQIRAFGQVMSASSEMGVTIAITLAAAVVIIYTMSGGLRADVMTDLVQGIGLIVGLVVVLVGVVAGMGGLSAAAGTIEPRQLRLFGDETTSTWQLLEAWMTPICGSLVAQELVSRVIACRAPQVARNASLIAAAMYLAIGVIPVFLGLTAAQFLPGLENPEQTLPLLARRHLSQFAYVLFAGALISAILSTVDSCLLAASALVSHNLIAHAIPTMSEAAVLRTARGGVVVFGILAYVLALRAESVYHLVEEASALGSAGIFVILVFGLFTRFGGRWSATAALVAGMVAYLGASWTTFDYPFLGSLGAALFAYAFVAVTEQARPAIAREG